MHITTVEVEVFYNLDTFTTRANQEVNQRIDELIKKGAVINDVVVTTYTRPGKQYFVYTIKHTAISI